MQDSTSAIRYYIVGSLFLVNGEETQNIGQCAGQKKNNNLILTLKQTRGYKKVNL